MTTKITLSLPDELVAQARAAVASGKVASVSAYVKDAMQRFGREDTLSRLLADLTEEHGEPSVDARASEDVKQSETRLATRSV